MDRAELRARQAPLRQQYRDDPDSATTPLRAEADFRDARQGAMLKLLLLSPPDQVIAPRAR